MSIYDVLEEISVKKGQRTPAGDNVVHGVMVGVVTENKNDENKGKISVQIPVRNGENNIVKLVKTAMPLCGKDWGFYFLPEIGDQVLLAFESGNMENPYIIGAIPKNATNFINKAYNSKNAVKRIRTKGGNQLEMNDNKDKEFIELVTPKSRSLRMDDGEQTITVTDEKGKNKLVLDTGKGTALLEVVNKITLKAGNTTVEINGQSDTVTITCGQFTVKAQSGISETTNTHKIKASSFQVKASGVAALKSDGMVSIKGQTISVG